MAAHIHVIGGGLAGLSAATALATKNVRLTLYEAGSACGGRARSYEDAHLGARIDNGNHLLLSGNHATMTYLDRIGSRASLYTPAEPLFPFYDLKHNLAWSLHLSEGRIPWWLGDANKRVPGAKLWEYLTFMKLAQAQKGQTVADCLMKGYLAQRLIEPLAISALNTPLEVASASLMGAIVRETLSARGDACIPMFPSVGLSESFVLPAIDFLEFMNAHVKMSARVTSMQSEGKKITSFALASGENITLDRQDKIILACPATVAAHMVKPILPDFQAPDIFESIINIHYRLSESPSLKGAVARTHFCGASGGLVEWVFIKKNIISVTISAANRYASYDHTQLENKVWQEVRTILNGFMVHPLGEEKPPTRLIWEKRATFAATDQQNAKRPTSQTAFENLFLAGDWTATGLPATIEGAIRSGINAITALGFTA